MIRLPQNQACGDSNQCARGCQSGAYHIVQDNLGGSYFGCAYEVDQCNKPSCTFGLSEATSEESASRTVCETVGGRLCPFNFLSGQTVNFCVILSSNQANYPTACKEAEGTEVTNGVLLPYSLAARNC